jgi:hypothetical protein
VSETTLRRLSELALIGIASIWGLTFVMVKDAIEELPTMAFLAYRFIPAALIGSTCSPKSPTMSEIAPTVPGKMRPGFQSSSRNSSRPRGGSGARGDCFHPPCERRSPRRE